MKPVTAKWGCFENNHEDRELSQTDNASITTTDEATSALTGLHFREGYFGKPMWVMSQQGVMMTEWNRSPSSSSWEEELDEVWENEGGLVEDENDLDIS